MLYFYLHERRLLVDRLFPVLSECWQDRSFEPARDLFRSLLSAARSFAERYHLGPEEPVLCMAVRGLAFDRNIWRALVGELLVMAAVEVPELETAADSLCCLLAPERYADGSGGRERFAPIERVHHGSRYLQFGSACYRPLHAGWNDADDVHRLSAYLDTLDPAGWTPSDLEAQRDLGDDQERAEELEFARQCFSSLLDLYRKASENSLVVVCEDLE